VAEVARAVGNTVAVFLVGFLLLAAVAAGLIGGFVGGVALVSLMVNGASTVVQVVAGAVFGLAYVGACGLAGAYFFEEVL
jgi:hypothetical protein